MDVTADRVIVELEAKLGRYEANVAKAETGFTRAMGNIEKSAGSTERAISKSFASISGRAAALAGAGVAALGVALAGVVISAVRAAGEIKKTSEALGISTRSLQEYRYAAEIVGVSQETLSDGFKRLNDLIGKAALGAKQPSRIFQTLGVDIRDAAGKVRDASSVLPELADRLNAIPDPAERAATAALIFGDKAADLRPLLEQGSKGMDTLRASAERLGIVLSDKQLQEADQLGRKLDDLRRIITTDITAAVVNNADAILTLARGFATLTENVLGSIQALSNFSSIRNLRSPTATRAQQNAAARSLMSSQAGRDALLADVDARLERNSKDRAAGRGNRRSILGGLVELTDKANDESNAALDREFKRLVRERNAILRANNNAAKAGGTTNGSGGPPPSVGSLLSPDGRKLKTPKGKQVQTLEEWLNQTAIDVSNDVFKQAGAGAEDFNRDSSRAYDDAMREVEKRLEAERDLKRMIDEDAFRRQEDQIVTLANLYEDAFRGGTKAIWSDFKQIGTRIVAEVLARFTLSRINGGGFDLGSALGSAVGSVLPGFAGGGSGIIGGRGGTDNNVLSLNGKPFAKVSRDERLSIENRAISGRGGGATVVQNISIDARNSVNPDGFARQILSISGHQAQQAAATMGQGVIKAMPARLAQYQTDGT